MKKNIHPQRIWFYITLTVFLLMLLYTGIEIFVMLTDGGKTHPIHAAVSFAHLFFWIPMTVVSVALLITNYKHLQKKCHSVKAHHTYQKVLRLYLLMYTVVVVFSLLVLLGSALLHPLATDILVVAAYVLLTAATAMLLRHSVRLKDYME